MDPRERLVAEARSWIGTPYHHRARVKGAGVDCAWLLIEAFTAAGLIEAADPGVYAHDWMIHRDEERYLQFVERYADEFDPALDVPRPGDVVVWKFGRTFSHGAIVTAWPRVVHAYAPYGMVDEGDASLPSPLTLMKDGSRRPMRAYRLRGL